MTSPVLQAALRFFSPLYLFRDAARGTMYERAAAYRHNRRMRVHLPVYLRRLALTCTILLALLSSLDPAGSGADGVISVPVLIAACFGVLFACGLCMLFVTAYTYFYLSRNDSL